MKEAFEKNKDIIILGIESSCDDTSAAVIRNGFLLSNVIASQAVHSAYGGVVPELASRAHQQNIIPTVSEAIKRAGIQKEDISAIAYTRGPGLIGSLLVGNSFAKGFATALNIPMEDLEYAIETIKAVAKELPQSRTLEIDEGVTSCETCWLREFPDCHQKLMAMGLDCKKMNINTIRYGKASVGQQGKDSED